MWKSVSAGKKDGSALGEASWNGPSPSWMEQLGALGSVNSDAAHNNTVRHWYDHCCHSGGIQALLFFFVLR